MEYGGRSGLGSRGAGGGLGKAIMVGRAGKEAGGRCGGFTLIELLIVLFLLFVLFTWGMPDLRRMITNTHLATISNSLLADLRQAQANAMTYGMAWLCPVPPGGQADPGTCGTAWEDGWQVVRLKQGEETGTFTLLRVQEPVPRNRDDDSPQITISANGNLTNGVCFNAQGYPQGLQMGNPPQCTGLGTGTFTICRMDRTHGTDAACRHLVIANTGRMRIETPTWETPPPPSSPPP